MSYNPVGSESGFALDGTMHKLGNLINMLSRKAVSQAARNVNDVNNALAEKAVIVEPQTSRADISQTIFDRLTKIEDIIAKSKLNGYYKNAYVSKTVTLQELKNRFKALTQENRNENENVVDEMIGGR